MLMPNFNNDVDKGGVSLMPAKVIGPVSADMQAFECILNFKKCERLVCVHIAPHGIKRSIRHTRIDIVHNEVALNEPSILQLTF